MTGDRIYSRYRSPIGEYILVAEGGALTEIRYHVDTENAGVEAPDDVLLKAVSDWLDGYFAGTIHEFPFGTIPLRPIDETPFRHNVWKVMCTIPWGETISYGGLAELVARRTGRRSAARAVGNASGANPIPIIIPCHRVIGADGSLTGYGGGLDRKKWLLRHEGAIEEDLF